jgi:integrase
MRKVIWPAAKRAGITRRIGWHTFRRSMASLLVGEGAPAKLTQEVMRHANASDPSAHRKVQAARR